MTPLVRAPHGYVWRWRTYRIAHLVKNPYPPPQDSLGLCGKRSRGVCFAFQVGGVTAQPCPECVAQLGDRSRLPGL